jgi:hypothetical protein
MAARTTTQAANTKRPPTATALALALRDKVKDALWEMFVESLEDCSNDFDIDTVVTNIHRILDVADDNGAVEDKLKALRLLNVRTETYKIELSRSGVRKVLDDLDNRCFSEADKKNIRAALGAEDDDDDDE